MTKRTFLTVCICILNVVSAFAVKPTVAISYFDNTSDNSTYAPLSKGLADMLITDLSEFDGITIVEREDLDELLAEIELGDSGFISTETAQQLGRGLGASHILTGSFLVFGEQVRIDSKIVAVESGEILLAESVTGAPSRFFALQRELSGQLITTLGIELSRRDQQTLRHGSATLEDALTYSQAIEKLDAGRVEEALAQLEGLVDASPEFTSVYTRLDIVLEELDAILAARNSLADRELVELILAVERSPDVVHELRNRLWSGITGLNTVISDITWGDGVAGARDKWLVGGLRARPDDDAELADALAQRLANYYAAVSLIDDRIGKNTIIQGIQPAVDIRAYQHMVWIQLALFESNPPDEEYLPDIDQRLATVEAIGQHLSVLFQSGPWSISVDKPFVRFFLDFSAGFVRDFPNSVWTNSVRDSMNNFAQ